MAGEFSSELAHKLDDRGVLQLIQMHLGRRLLSCIKILGEQDIDPDYVFLLAWLDHLHLKCLNRKQLAWIINLT